AQFRKWMILASSEALYVTGITTNIVEQGATIDHLWIVVVTLRTHTQQCNVLNQVVYMGIRDLGTARATVGLVTTAIRVGEHIGHHPHIGIKRRGNLMLDAGSR